MQHLWQLHLQGRVSSVVAAQPTGHQLNCVRIAAPRPVLTLAPSPASGTKFNSRLENAAGEDYLGIQVVRLYIKCPRCSAEIALKTDPKNSDYILEAGATRNYEPWRETETQVRPEQGIQRTQRRRRSFYPCSTHRLIASLPLRAISEKEQ